MKKFLFLICFPISVFAQEKLPYFDIDLIKQFYAPKMITEDGGGIYTNDNYDYKVTVEKKYSYDERASYWDSRRLKTLIVLFKNIPINKNYEVLDCHACSGFVGLAKYQYENKKWRLKNFTNDCLCGSASYGKVAIPVLEEYEGVPFLVYKSFYGQHGVSTERISYHNTHNFNKAFSFVSSEDNNGNIEPGEKGNYANQSKVSFVKNKDGNLQLNLISKGTKIEKYNGPVLSANKSENYIYDNVGNTFIKK